MKDFEVSKKVDVFIANSKTTQRRIKKYYGRDSEIIYPFVNFDKYKDVEPISSDFFLVITRLVAWKKVDIAIKAFNEIEKELRIIGDGPDLNRLKSLASPSIKFLGYASEKEKIENIRKCKAVIITQKEDFGIVPLECMACGKPIIAFGGGGATESILSEITGEFFEEQSSTSLKKVVEGFNPDKYSPLECKNRASKFDRKIFEKDVKKIINV